MNNHTTINMIVNEITDWIDFLIKINLTRNTVNYPSTSPSKVTFKNSTLLSSVSNLDSYDDIYRQYLEKDIYNILTRDGAMIQITYVFKNQQLTYHRLAFFPAPTLDFFWDSLKDFSHPDLNLPDLDEELEDLDRLLPYLYKDITETNIVRFPLRFDYDDTISETQADIEHPKVHLTLGEYTDCRIPVVSPLPPSIFLDFILRNFYSRTFSEHYTEKPISNPELSEVLSNIKEPVTNYKDLYIDY